MISYCEMMPMDNISVVIGDDITDGVVEITINNSDCAACVSLSPEKAMALAAELNELAQAIIDERV